MGLDKRVQPPVWTSNPLPSRTVQLQTLSSTKEFDVLVIGGGATGCGVALDAVTRGVLSDCFLFLNFDMLHIIIFVSTIVSTTLKLGKNQALSFIMAFLFSGVFYN